MTTKFLQALAKLKPSSPSQVSAARKQARTSPRGAVAFQVDVYRRKRVRTLVNLQDVRVGER